MMSERDTIEVGWREVVAGVSLIAIMLLVGVVGSSDPPAQSYYKHVATATAVLKGERVLVSDLSNIQDMIKHDGRFQETLRSSGFTEEDIQRLVGEEFLYVQVKAK